MFYDFKVPIPKEGCKTYTIFKDGVYPVLMDIERTYDQKKQYTTVKRATIGRAETKDAVDMYPNDKYREIFGTEGFPEDRRLTERSSAMKAGVWIVLDKLIRQYGMPAIFDTIGMKRNNAALILDLAAYNIITEDNAAQYYEDYAFDHALFTEDMRIYSDSKISRLIREEITADHIADFLGEWNDRKGLGKNIYVSYDATNKNCQAGDIDIVDYGNAKTDTGAPIVNIAMAYDTDNREPLFYEEYEGSIPDTKQLKSMVDRMKAYGYKRMGIILDRGYFSRSNLEYMEENGFEYLIMMKGKKDIAEKLILKNRGSFENLRANYIPDHDLYGVTTKDKLQVSDRKGKYFHLFYAPGKMAAEQNELNQNLKKMRHMMERHIGEWDWYMPDNYGKWFIQHFFDEKRDDGEMHRKFIAIEEKDDAIDSEMATCGYFVIISSARMTAAEAIELYKSRDASEKLFRADKTYLGDASFRVHSEEAMRSKTFIAFIALILRNNIYTQLKKKQKGMEKSVNYLTVPAAIRQLEKVELSRMPDGSYIVDHAVTAKQREVFSAFDIDMFQVNGALNRLREDMRKIFLKEGGK